MVEANLVHALGGHVRELAVLLHKGIHHLWSRLALLVSNKDLFLSIMKDRVHKTDLILGTVLLGAAETAHAALRGAIAQTVSLEAVVVLRVLGELAEGVARGRALGTSHEGHDGQMAAVLTTAVGGLCC